MEVEVVGSRVGRALDGHRSHATREGGPPPREAGVREARRVNRETTPKGHMITTTVLDNGYLYSTDTGTVVGTVLYSYCTVRYVGFSTLIELECNGK